MNERMPPLREWLEEIDRFCCRSFDQREAIPATIFYIRDDGQRDIFLIPRHRVDQKDFAMNIVRLVLDAAGAVRCAYVAEAFVIESAADLSPETIARLDRDGAENEPGRIECVCYMAEDQREGMLAASREIIRDGNRARLAPLKFFDTCGTSQGRAAGLLPRGKAAVN